MNVEKFLQKYREEIRYAARDGGYEIAFPFKFYNDDCVSSVFICEDETGLFTVTDNGNTLNYLENKGINPQDFADKIQKICKAFHLTIANGIIRRTLGEYETNQTFTQLTSFFIGISHVATVNIF